MDIEKNSIHQHNIQTIFKSIEEKITKIQNILKRNSSNMEQNQRHMILINKFKEKFYKNFNVSF